MEDFLKEIWPAAIIIAISIFSGIRNASKMPERKQDAQQPQPDTLDENFPEVEVFESPFVHPSETATPRPSFEKRRPSKEYVSVKSATKPVDVPEAPAAERGAKVAFKGKNDAKKAFIYSEILNRKYT